MRPNRVASWVALVLLAGCGRWSYQPLSGGGDGGPVTDAPIVDAPIDNPPTVCSTSSATAADLTVVNDYTTITLRLYWIDDNCVEQPYDAVAPGATEVQPSYVTHPWRLRDEATGALLAEIPPLTGNTTVTVP